MQVAGSALSLLPVPYGQLPSELSSAPHVPAASDTDTHQATLAPHYHRLWTCPLGNHADSDLKLA